MVASFSSTTMRNFWSLALATQTLLSGAALVHGAILTERYSSSPEYDVIVVGGGYSGLMAAHDLNKAGLNTLVLEAKEDIGGKTRSIQLESGPGIVELGATWINNVTQPEVYKLTEQFGLKTLVQYTAGDTVFQDPTGNIVRIPAASPPEVSTIKLNHSCLWPKPKQNDNSTADPQTQLFEFIDAAAEQVDLYNSSSFPADQDLSVEDWFKVQDLWDDPEVQATVSFLTISLVGREPDEIGVHYWLDYIKSGLGLQSLSTEDQGGAQFLMIESGM
jgi:monoamine oxidase